MTMAMAVEAVRGAMGLTGLTTKEGGLVLMLGCGCVRREAVERFGLSIDIIVDLASVAPHC
jgi:hypothetical protein